MEVDEFYNYVIAYQTGYGSDAVVDSTTECSYQAWLMLREANYSARFLYNQTNYFLRF
jgi:hypothetical protein